MRPLENPTLKSTDGKRIKLALFGASEGGLKALKALNTIHAVETICCFDNDLQKDGRFLNGLPIIHYSPGAHERVDLILISSIHTLEILAQLTQDGAREKIAFSVWHLLKLLSNEDVYAADSIEELKKKSHNHRFSLFREWFVDHTERPDLVGPGFEDAALSVIETEISLKRVECIQVHRPSIPTRTIILPVITGLSNRLFGILASLRFAQLTQSILYVVWYQNAHCACRFQDLFHSAECGFPKLSEGNPLTHFGFHDSHSYSGEIPSTELENQNILLTDAFQLFSIQQLDNPLNQMWPVPDWSYEFARKYLLTNLNAELQTALEDWNSVTFENTIAFHIRRPYPGTAFTSYDTSIREQGLPFEFFMELIECIFEIAETSITIFLACNDFDWEQRIKVAWGERIRFRPKKSIDNTRSPVAVQDALMDAILTSKCSTILTQSTSGFGKFAHMLGQKPAHQIIDYNANVSPPKLTILSRYPFNGIWEKERTVQTLAERLVVDSQYHRKKDHD